MKSCPNCGFENSDDSKFCISCGGGLSEVKVPEAAPMASEKTPVENDHTEDCLEPSENDKADGRQTPANGAGTAAEGLSEADPEQGQEDPTVEQTNSATRFISGLFDKYGKKRLSIAVGVAVALLIVVIVAFGALTDGPSEAQIKNDVEQTANSWTSVGTYGYAGAYEVSSIDITEKNKEEVPAGAQELFGGIGDTSYAVKVKATASNGAVDSEAVLSGSYVKYEGKWQPLSLNVESVTSRAVKGVNPDSVQENASQILASVKDGNQDGGLSSIYRDAAVKVGKVSFDEDAQTSKVKLSYAAEDAFSSAKATVTANFTFENNAWSLASAQADEGAKTISYDKLIGTWKGAFEETSHGKASGANCYGAEGGEPELTITSVDSKSLKIEGTFTGLIHDHASLKGDANSCDGDRVMEATPFTATLSESSYPYGKVGAECTFPSSGGSTTQITFGFGTNSDDDPNGAYLEVLHCFQCDPDSFFLPDPAEKWEDVYRLKKAE